MAVFCSAAPLTTARSGRMPRVTEVCPPDLIESRIDPETGMDTAVETNRHAPPSCRTSPCRKFMLGLPTNLATVILTGLW